MIRKWGLRPLLGKAGQSMIETMIAAGLIGGIAVTLSQVGTSTKKVEKVHEATSRINEVTYLVQNAMYDKDNCNSNFTMGAKPALKDTSKITEKDSTSVIDIANNASVYSKSGFSLDSITFSQAAGNPKVGMVDFGFSKIVNNTVVEKVKRSVSIQLILDASGNFKSCYSDITHSIYTNKWNIIKKACVGPGFMFDETDDPNDPNDNTDPDNPRCVIDGAHFSDIKCNVDQEFLVGLDIKYEASTGIVVAEPKCAKVFDCNANEMVVIKGDKISCKKLCGSTQLGLFNLSDTEGLSCIDLECKQTGTEYEYLGGIKQDGTKMCRTLVSSSPAFCNKRIFLQVKGTSVEAACH